MNILNSNDQLNITSDINFNNNKGVNLANPTSTQDASTKAYVDAQIATIDNTKLSLTGGLLSGLLNFGGLSLTNTSTINQNVNTISSPTFAGVSSTGALNIGTQWRLIENAGALEVNNISTGLQFYSFRPGGFTNSHAAGTGGAGVEYRSSLGTISVPTATQNTNTVSQLNFNGHNGSGYIQTGAIKSISTQNWTVGNCGSKIQLFSTPLNTSGMIVVLELDAANISIGRAATILNTNSMCFNANGSTILQSTANNQIRFAAGTTTLDYDGTGMSLPLNVSSTSVNTGTLKVTGGVGITQNLNVGGVLNQPLSWCELWWAFNQAVANTLVTSVGSIGVAGIQPVLTNGTTPVTSMSGTDFTVTSPGANRFALTYNGTSRRARIVVTGNYVTTSGTTVVFFQAITRNGTLLNGTINSWWQSNTNQIFTATSQKTLLLNTGDIIEVVTGVDPLVVPAFPRTTLVRDLTISITTLINNA